MAQTETEIVVTLDSSSIEAVAHRVVELLADRESEARMFDSGMRPSPKAVPTFAEFSHAWLGRRHGSAPVGIGDYEWAVAKLLPHFGHLRLSEITLDVLRDYCVRKPRDGSKTPATIKRSLRRLSQILGEAVEYGYLEGNVMQRKAAQALIPKGGD